MSDSQPSQDSTVTITEENRNEVIYFAYGSNLSTQQMLQRCPSSKPIGLGYLPGWRWIINQRGYANIIPSSQLSHPCWSSSSLQPHGNEEDGVYGLLYFLPKDDEATLDACEGVPHAYQKVAMDVDWIGDEDGMKVGQYVQALIYVDDKRVEGSIAKEEYKGRMQTAIEDGLRNWGLGERYAEGMRGWLRQ